MTHPQFDPDQYKVNQRREWGDLADGWRKWWPLIESSFQPFSDKMIEMASVAGGHRVLDIATGIGEPALTAAKIVGASGHVIATDQAPPMLQVAQERASELGLQNMEFREMDAENLALPAESFDVALCRFGLMFLPNLDGALKSIHDVLVSGGRLSAAVWGPPQESPMLSLPMRVVQQFIDIPAPPPNVPGPFNLADQSLLQRTFEQAGFSSVSVEKIAILVGIPSASIYLEMLQDTAGPVTAIMNNQPPEKVTEIVSAIVKAMEQFADDSGALAIPATANCVVGTR
ncbi:MAG: class I SAM-dependent methyltransferase [SAR202 cluster bacterium]|nr:class I SAM-dependent methyltransferase [SAR202 cluster bacterium]MDP6514477.1 class I SAM-dependent methyltransferase [SAR202 cluster bacterium]MDP6716258.1 class I SAM-dependent methyltransferase [SAR202 cluster bacterium]